MTWPIIQDKPLDEIKSHALFQTRNFINQRLFFIDEEILPTLANLKKSSTQEKIILFRKLFQSEYYKNKKQVQNNLAQALSKNERDAFKNYVNYITLAWNQSFSNRIEIKKWAFLFSRPLSNRVSSQLIYILPLIIASPLILLYFFDSLFKLAIVLPIYVFANTIGYLRDKLFLTENMGIIFQYGRSILLVTLTYPLFYLSKTFGMIVDQVISLITLMTPLQKIHNIIENLTHSNVDTVGESFTDIEESLDTTSYLDNTATLNNREVKSNSEHSSLTTESQEITTNNIFCTENTSGEKTTQELDHHSLSKDSVLLAQGLYRNHSCIENTAESVVKNGPNIKIKS